MSASFPGLSYARALFETAENAGASEVVYQNFKRLIVLLKESAELSSFIRTRSLDANRAQILSNIFSEEFHPLTIKFFKFLAFKNRLENLLVIIEEFIGLYQDKKGIATVTVTSFGSLDAPTLEAISSHWRRQLNQTVELKFQTDPSLLGGVVFKVKDQLSDYSIKAQLDRLREKLMKA